MLLGGQQALMYTRDRLFQQGVDLATSDHRETALQVAVFALATIAGASIVRVLSRIVVFNAGRNAEFELRSEMLRRLHLLGPSFFRTIPTGDILSRATNDLGQVRLLLGFGILNVVNTMFALVSALSVMVGVSATLTLASLASAPLLMLVTRWFSRQLYIRNKGNQEALGAMSDRVQASLAGVRVVRSLSLEKTEISSFEKACEEYLEKSLSLAKLRGFMGPTLGSVGAIGILTVFWYGGYMVITHQITQGQFVAFWAALTRLVWPLLALGFVVSIVQRGRASFDRLRAIYEADPDVKDGPLPAPAVVKGALKVQNLSFAYGERPVLSDVSFEVEAGHSVAIVGRTGSGKSTLAALLPRLLPTPKNNVFLDGVDVCDLPLRSLRQSIGYAQQDSFLFSTTVAHNIGFALDDIDTSEAQTKLITAATEAQVLSEIKTLPDGWDTVVGERGIQLSGGQRQRVALARAFVWEPAILVLDDPLSAVDARTEAKILDAIDRQAAHRTLVLITHRIAAASRCDQIVVLDKGTVVEQGTHEELLKQGGIYSQFAEEQRREGNADSVEQSQIVAVKPAFVASEATN